MSDDIDSNNQIIVPFLKWAGGKRWLVNQHPELFPKTYVRYIEPFVGSGAVYFHLKPQKAILGDANFELIDCYKAIKKDWLSVWKLLKRYQQKHDKDFYYKMRSLEASDQSSKAARFIYLNRTCWNGLYRVNKLGKFNVPIGSKTAVTMETDDFEASSNLLKTASLHVADFEKILDKSEKGDFVFIDPPYTINHNLNGFIKYNQKLFSWDDQVRLKDAILRAQKRKAKVLLTNADHESIALLYKGLGKAQSIERASVISGINIGRGKFAETVIRFWDD